MARNSHLYFDGGAQDGAVIGGYEP